jgi:hypothetical protein
MGTMVLKVFTIGITEGTHSSQSQVVLHNGHEKHQSRRDIMDTLTNQSVADRPIRTEDLQLDW